MDWMELLRAEGYKEYLHAGKMSIGGQMFKVVQYSACVHTSQHRGVSITT